MAYGDQEHMWRLAARYSALGIEMAVAVVLPTLLGHWLDTRWHSSPLCLFVGLAIGVGAAVQSVWRVVKQTKLSKL